MIPNYKTSCRKLNLQFATPFCRDLNGLFRMTQHCPFCKNIFKYYKHINESLNALQCNKCKLRLEVKKEIAYRPEFNYTSYIDPVFYILEKIEYESSIITYDHNQNTIMLNARWFQSGSSFNLQHLLNKINLFDDSYYK